MKRDMDLVRDILRFVEENSTFDDGGINVSIAGHSDDEVKYHLSLLAQAGLVTTRSIEYATDAPDIFATGLTWQGHEFLDAARSDTVWAKAKALLKQKGLDWSFDLLKTSLIQIGKHQLGLPGDV